MDFKPIDQKSCLQSRMPNELFITCRSETINHAPSGAQKRNLAHAHVLLCPLSLPRLRGQLEDRRRSRRSTIRSGKALAASAPVCGAPCHVPECRRAAQADARRDGGLLAPLRVRGGVHRTEGDCAFRNCSPRWPHPGSRPASSRPFRGSSLPRRSEKSNPWGRS